ncbi:MAG: hypothetical protein AB1765_10265 [Candidatus Hydrogenedentota bacterium]
MNDTKKFVSSIKSELLASLKTISTLIYCDDTKKISQELDRFLRLFGIYYDTIILLLNERNYINSFNFNKKEGKYYESQST